MAPSEVEYNSIWPILNHRVLVSNREKAMLLANGDEEMATAMEYSMVDNFDELCKGVYTSLRLTPYFDVMGGEVKQIWYEKEVWKICFPNVPFVGDSTKLDDFLYWFDGVSKEAAGEITDEEDKEALKDVGIQVKEERAGKDHTDITEVLKAFQGLKTVNEDDEEAATEVIDGAEAESGKDSGSGGVPIVGVRIGGYTVVSGETEDRYADGEDEDTDGGVKLKWILN